MVDAVRNIHLPEAKGDRPHVIIRPPRIRPLPGKVGGDRRRLSRRAAAQGQPPDRVVP